MITCVHQTLEHTIDQCQNMNTLFCRKSMNTPPQRHMDVYCQYDILIYSGKHNEVLNDDDGEGVSGRGGEEHEEGK